MSPAGRKKSKPGVLFALLIVAIFLMLLVNHLMNFEYNPQPLEGSGGPPVMRATATVVEQFIDGSRVPCVCLTLTNAGKSRLTLLDTDQLDPLYDFELQKRLPDGRLDPLPRAPQFSSLALSDSGDAPRVQEVTLLPGRGMSTYLPLTPAYDLRGASGEYNVTVQYRPDALMRSMKRADVERLSANAPTVSCQVDFTWPLVKPEAPPGKPPPAPQRMPAAQAMEVEPSERKPPPLPVEAPK